MSQREIAFEIEDLQLAAEEINSMQNALFAALYESTYAKEDLRQAFRAFGGMTYKLKIDLQNFMTRAFADLKDTKKEISGRKQDKKGIEEFRICERT